MLLTDVRGNRKVWTTESHVWNTKPKKCPELFFMLEGECFLSVFKPLTQQWTPDFSASGFAVVVPSLSHVWLFMTPWTAAYQAFLSIIVSQSLLKLMSIESVMPTIYTIDISLSIRSIYKIDPNILSSVTPFSSCLQSFPTSGSCPMNQLFASGGQSIGVSASASVLPMNIQGCFPLGLTGLILLSKSSLAQFESVSPSVLSFPCGPALTSIHDYWKNHSFD